MKYNIFFGLCEKTRNFSNTVLMTKLKFGKSYQKKQPTNTLGFFPANTQRLFKWKPRIPQGVSGEFFSPFFCTSILSPKQLQKYVAVVFLHICQEKINFIRLFYSVTMKNVQSINWFVRKWAKNTLNHSKNIKI